MGRSHLGEFELIVLLAVLQLGDDEAHPPAIVDEIRRRTGREVRRSAVYVTLQRLETKDLVTSWLSQPRPERGGKARRCVRLTVDGAAAVAESQTALRSMWQGLDRALESALDAR